MIKRILVAMDGSPASLAAVEYAAAWVARLKAGVVGMFVADEQRFVYYAPATAADGGAMMPIPLPEDRMREETAKVAEEEKEIAAAFEKAMTGRKVAAQFKSERGDVNALLLREARMSDLVVIGKRGRFEASGSESAGPTTEALIHDAMRPVLVVPEKARIEGPFLIAYDESRGVQRILPVVADLAASTGQNANATVLTVDSKPDRAAQLQASAKGYFANHGIHPKFLVEHGRAAGAIVKAAESQGAGMIAMGAFNRNPVYELFFGSTTLSVLERAPCPVLLTA